MHRFYSEETIQGEGSPILLGKEESLHALRVLRLRPGEEVQLLDGKNLWAAVLKGDEEGRAFMNVLRRLPSPEAECRVTLWQGLPKADKLEWIIQKGTELGAACFWPVDMERSVAHSSKGDRDGKKQERLAKIALEAAKQSGRACVPTVAKAMSFADACLAAEKEAFDAILVAWEEEHALLLSEALKQARPKDGELRKLLVVIGPEGGIAPEEYARLEALRAKAVSLGKRILRTETAGLCALSVIWAVLGEM